MKKLLLLMGLMGMMAASAQVTKTLTLSSNGTVVKPVDFWSVNASGIEAATTQRKFPVFRIDVPRLSGFTDFALKASEVNFGGTYPFTPAIVYFYYSVFPTGGAAQIWSAPPKVWFTDSSSSDPRRWRLQPTIATIKNTLTNTTNGEVGSIVVAPQETAAWCVSTNKKLTWVYCLFNAGTSEKDATLRPIWRPILPVSWETSLPTP